MDEYSPVCIGAYKQSTIRPSWNNLAFVQPPNQSSSFSCSGPVHDWRRIRRSLVVKHTVGTHQS
jgi:hypothetical protein